MALLRAYFAAVALLAPSLVVNPRAEHDWRPVIVQPSVWDWLPAAAHLPSLGRHPIPRGARR